MDEMQTTQKVVNIAQSMIDGSLGLIEGCRKLVDMKYKLHAETDPNFLFLTFVDSETDHFPVGQVRNNYSKKGLEKVDSEINEYLLHVRQDILEACKNIIKTYG